MKCLIVEDDAITRLDFVEAMRNMQYDCFEAASIAQAGYLLKTHDFEVILLDLRVSDGLTLALADYLNVVNKSATVILITGTGAFPHGEHTQFAPRVDYLLHKPVKINDLVALVDYSAQKQSVATGT